MRVIAGEHRGRRLDAPRTASTRPTPDRVREALFSALEVRLGGPGSLADASVLDLYAGSGALGIEALSRGAASAVFVEKDPEALRVLERNLDRLDLESRSRVVRAEVQGALRRLVAAGERFDAILVDPPFASKEIGGTLAMVAAGECLRAGGIAVVEHPTSYTVEPPAGLGLVTSRAYGRVSLSFLRFEKESVNQPPSGPEDRT